jgi:hypothetical protein
VEGHRRTGGIQLQPILGHRGTAIRKHRRVVGGPDELDDAAGDGLGVGRRHGGEDHENEVEERGCRGALQLALRADPWCREAVQMMHLFSGMKPGKNGRTEEMLTVGRLYDLVKRSFSD